MRAVHAAAMRASIVISMLNAKSGEWNGTRAAMASAAVEGV